MDLKTAISKFQGLIKHRSVKRGLILSAVITVIVSLIWYASRPEYISVKLQRIDSGRVEATVANTRAGTIKPCRRARIAPTTSGQVTFLPVKEGDRVKAGQVLLRLWNKDLVAKLRLAKSEVVTSRIKVKEACLVADSARREAERLLRLKAKRLVADDRVDRAVTDAAAKNEACQATKTNVQVSKNRVAVARAALERTILRAPFAGVVAEINAELGEVVTPSPPGIATPAAVDLIDNTCLYVTAPIDEVDAPKIRPGMRARITLDALAGKYFDGKVRRVAPYVLDVEKQARTVDVEVEFIHPEKARSLLTGYSADIEVILMTRKNVLRVPTEAVLEGHRVLIFNPRTKRLEERRIKPGLTNWKYTEIKSGLTADELIVISVAREGVKPGAKVRPENSLPDISGAND